MDTYKRQQQKMIAKRLETSRAKGLDAKQLKANLARSQKLQHPPLSGNIGDMYSKTFLCTHGWKHRQRGTGRRKKQKVRSTKCKAGFVAKVVPNPAAQDGAKFVIEITSQTTCHNHRIGPDIWKYYAENRRVPQHLEEEASTMKSVGGSIRKIVAYLQKKSGIELMLILCLVLWHYVTQRVTYLSSAGNEVTPEDVHNLLYRLRQERHRIQGDVHKRVRALLDEFVEQEGNVARVFKDEESDVASCITLQTKAMRKFYKVFPEILIIDATHGKVWQCCPILSECVSQWCVCC